MFIGQVIGLMYLDTCIGETNHDIGINLAQGWANFLYGGPHLKKMLQPRAAHSHYKIGKFILCVKKTHIHIKHSFCISHSGALGRRAPRLRTPASSTGLKGTRSSTKVRYLQETFTNILSCNVFNQNDK